MIVLVGKPKRIRCLECGELIEGEHIIRPHPWFTMAFHPDCARDLANELGEEAAQYYCTPLAAPT